MRACHALLLAATVAIACSTASPSWAGDASVWAPGNRVPGRVVITLRQGVSPHVAKSASGLAVDVPALQAAANRFQVTDMSQTYAGVPPGKAGAPDLSLIWTIDFPPELDLDTVLQAYAELPEVSKARAVDICALFDAPDDPGLDAQWHLRNTTLGGKDIRAVGGWAEAHGDTNVIVAIVDSGVDWQHPDLGGSGPDYRRGAIWTNWVEVNGTTNYDDDHNGKTDDYRGWDFVTGVQGEPGEDTNVPDNDPSDFESHGTACAGVAAAITDNAVGVAGASWGCKIMPVRVGWLPKDSTIGVVRMDFAANGMIYAAANGAKVINCSWGSTNYLEDAVSYCVSMGCIIVTAAGNANDEEASYLATHPEVITVAATDASDYKTSFSSFGTWVELSAPGTGIYTTWWNQSTATHTYAAVDGTSFSSPLTAGAMALVWSAHPTWNRTQVMNQILDTADDLYALNPAYAGKLGAGRVNLLRALGDHFQKVPDEFPTMLDAMNEASPGDTVAVRGSTFLTAPMSVANKALQVLGAWDETFSSRDPIGTPTTILANAGDSGFSFQTGTGLGTVVDGFRATGGGGLIFSNPQFGRYGGGLVCYNTSPTLRNLDITGNSVGSYSQFGGGGGVLLLNSNAVLENVSVHGNSAVQGGGVYVYLGAPVLRNCRIYDNTLVQDNGSYPPQGGGLHVIDATLTLEGCEISGHVDAESGGGLYAANYLASTNLILSDNEFHHNAARVMGGGLFMGGSSVTMRRDLFHDNGKAAGASFMDGGGFLLENVTATLDSITVRGNVASAGAGGSVVGGASFIMRNSIFSGNAADFFAGGVYCESVTTGELTGNTFVANSGRVGAAGLYLSGSSPAVGNNIFALGTGGTTLANGVYVSGATPAFTCNDAWNNVGANYGGVTDPTGTAGNIALDPLFCDAAGGDYGIDAASPCAPAHSGACGLIGALATSCSVTAILDDSDLPPLVFRVGRAAPNPFNPLTTIRFTIPAAARTTVRVYDLAGRLVSTLVDEDLAAAEHAVTWDGRDTDGRLAASGVYFYRVESGPHAYTGRMAMVK